MNQPKDMTVTEWCKQHNITKTNYYWHLKRVLRACLEQAEMSAGRFVELPVPTQCTVPSVHQIRLRQPQALLLLQLLYSIPLTVCISVEIMDNATAVKNVSAEPF